MDVVDGKIHCSNNENDDEVAEEENKVLNMSKGWKWRWNNTFIEENEDDNQLISIDFNDNIRRSCVRASSKWYHLWKMFMESKSLWSTFNKLNSHP